MNPVSRDVPSEEKAQRLTSSDGHAQSKSGGSLAMHGAGRHSPVSAHSPGIPGKLPTLDADTGRQNHGFAAPGFPNAGLPPGYPWEHLQLFPSLLLPRLMHPNTTSMYPSVLSNFLPSSQLAGLFPLPGADSDVSSAGWSAHTGVSCTTSSIGSSSSEGDISGLPVKPDSRAVRSSRYSPDPMSLSPAARKLWENNVSDATDMPLALVMPRRETTSRGSSAAESVVCAGESTVRAASVDTSRTPSLDGEVSCHATNENSGTADVVAVAASSVDVTNIQQATVPSVASDALRTVDDAKSAASDEQWSSNTATSRPSIALPPRKRLTLTRPAEEIEAPAAAESNTSEVAASSPSSAPNFRSVWKKFSAKSNVSGPPSHRAFGGKPLYDCRTYFQKLAEAKAAAAASKAFVAGKGKGHFYRNANKTSPRASEQNSGSPRVTRSQSKPKKTQSPKSSPSEPPAPVRKSTRKKSMNSRYEGYDRATSKNKKSKTMAESKDSNEVSDASKEAPEVLSAEEVGGDSAKSAQRHNRRRGKSGKPESLNVAEPAASVTEDADDSTLQTVADADQKLVEVDVELKQASLGDAAASTIIHNSSCASSAVEMAHNEPEPSLVITVLPPKFRHIKSKTASTSFDSSQLLTTDMAATLASESTKSLDAARSGNDASCESAASTTPLDVIAPETADLSEKSSTGPAEANATGTETAVEAPTEGQKMAQSHSVSGRKKLLQRSVAEMDSQLAADAKVDLIASHVDSSEVSASHIVGLSTNTSHPTSEASDICLSASAASVNSTHSVADSKSSSDALGDIKFASTVDSSLSEASTQNLLVHSVATTPCAVTLRTLPASVVNSVVCATSTSSSATDVLQERLMSEKPLCDAIDTEVAAVEKPLDISADSFEQDNTDGQSQQLSAVARLKPDASALRSDNTNPVSQAELAVLTSSSGMPLQFLPHANIAHTVSSLTCRISSDSIVSATFPTVSLKRSLPDNEPLSDRTKKKRRTENIEVDQYHDSLLTGIDEQPVIDIEANITRLVDYTSASSAKTNLQSDITDNNRKRSEPTKSKTEKLSTKLRLRRSRPSTPVLSELPLLENSGSSETASTKSECNTVIDSREPPLLEKSSSKASAHNRTECTTGIDEALVTDAFVEPKHGQSAELEVSKSICDATVLQVNGEQKTLRISLTAIDESDVSSNRTKDLTSESITTAVDQGSSRSYGSLCTELDSFSETSNSKACDITDVGAELSTESPNATDVSALERDCAALLSQCKSLSVVIEKMNSNKNSLPSLPEPSPLAKRSTKRRKARASAAPVADEEPPSNEGLSSSVRSEAEQLVPTSADDEYQFVDDAAVDNIPYKQTLRLSERKTTGRRTHNSVNTQDAVAMSPAALSDSSSHGAASNIESAVVSAAAGASSMTPIVSLPHQLPDTPEIGTVRPRRKKHSVPQDEDTRSSSPFSQNGTALPPPFVEASLDGHKLKLKISTKGFNRPVDTATDEIKLSVCPAAAFDFNDKPNEAEAHTLDLTDSVVQAKNTPVVISPRRRPKVEGVRSRFLTLHKPSGQLQSSDPVKCRLVKVGRRQWMSVGGEDADDSSSRQSDNETQVVNSPPLPPPDDTVINPTSIRLAAVAAATKKPHRRRGRPPKAQSKSPVISSQSSPKLNRKKVKNRELHADVIAPKLDKLPPSEVVVQRPSCDDPVPWLDSDIDCCEYSEQYNTFAGDMSRTLKADIQDCRLSSFSAEQFLLNVSTAASSVFLDFNVNLADCSTVLSTRSAFYVPSDIERLMEALALDDMHRRTKPLASPPPVRVSVSESHSFAASNVERTLSYREDLSSSRERANTELDRLLCQPSLRLRNCTLPVDIVDNSDYDCAVVGYEFPSNSLQESVEPTVVLDPSFVDDDISLLSASLAEPQMYSCADFGL